ncbi:glycosyltransferase family 4 protein [Maribellus sediminis]|uniref:glycosyltransferase family 4 protein n=1 Tax=Maribellus sediminis TaxID=2696285 RepID=UPI00143208C9|nr:glycosyltransferase family 4 protein [Maribellus sediminis]
MINLALITTRFVRQGPNKQLLHLIRNLDRTKINPIIITLSPERAPSHEEEFRKEDIEIIRLNLGLIKSLLFARKRIQQIVDSRQIHIVHSFTYATRVEFAIHRLKNVVKLATIRNSPKLSKNDYFGILGFFVYQMQMYFYRNMDKVIGCSESIYNLAELEKLPRVLIPNGIATTDNTSFTNWLKTKSEIRQTLQLPNHSEIFITVSNGLPIKNIEFLINYFKKKKNQTLVIAGNQNQKYKDLSNSSDNILFTGHVNNISQYYTAADFFISASYSEGLPNAVLESLLSGTPCILSKIPMHKEIIEKTGDNIGILFENNNEADLEANIAILKNRINSKTHGICSDFVTNHFSAKKMASSYGKLYESIKSI